MAYSAKKFSPANDTGYVPASARAAAKGGLAVVTGHTSTSGYRYVRTDEIPFRQWVRYKDNPRQRDVVERVNKGRADHLLKFDETHRKVVVGRFSNGDIYKADGHTRAFVWDKGLVRHPASVIAEIWECDSVEDLKSLYDKFDNPATQETGPDRVNGAARETGTNFNSAMLKSGEVSTALRELWYLASKSQPKKGDRMEVINKAFKYFTKDLKALDDLDPVRKRFPTHVVMAAILTLRVDPSRAFDFWKNYSAGRGNVVDGTRDAVAVFSERVTAITSKGGASTTLTKAREVMREAVAALKAYSLGKSYTDKRGYTSIDAEALRKYIDQVMKGVK